MRDEKLNKAYYQHGHLWIGSKMVKELYKITSTPKNNTKSWLAKEEI